MKLGKGRNPKKIMIEAVREVSEEEVAEARKATLPAVKKFRETHHMMARCFAMGMSSREVSNVMNMSQQRVSIFQSDPAFAELVASYRDSVNPEWREMAAGKQALLDYVCGMGLRQIADQMEDAEASDTPIPIPTLMRVTSDSLDRLGYAKKTISVHVEASFASKLDRAIERSGLKPALIEQPVVVIESRVQPPEVEGTGVEKGPGTANSTPVVPVEEKRRA